MCFTKPAVPKPGASPAPPPAAGADSLILGPSAQDDELLRNSGVLGRLALRIGGRGRGPAAPGAGGGGGGVPTGPVSNPIGSVGSGGGSSGGSSGGSTGGSSGGFDVGGGESSGAKFTQSRL